ncbi:MAG: hypothetical protein K2K98_04580 [Muribaculaceae bacterium]|nr:hypothetical protein [Muribaculaceae bacterium]
MSQPADIQPCSIHDILKILQAHAHSLPVSSTSSRYLRALDSLKSTIMGRRFPNRPAPSPDRAAGLSQGEKPVNTEPQAPILRSQYCEADPPYCEADTQNDNSSLIINNLSLSLTDWLINQWLIGTPFSTASLYLDIISSLYGSAVKAGQLPKTTLFSQLKSQLKALGANGWKSGIDDEIFTRALRLTKNATHLISDDAIAADLVIWSLTHGLQPLEQIALLKREDLVNGKAVFNRPVPSDQVDQVGTHGSCVRVLSPDCVADTPQDTEPSALKQRSQNSEADTPKDTEPQASKLRSQNCEADTTDHLLLSLIFNNLSLNSDSRRIYVFPLRQSQRTAAQLKKHIAKIVNALFRRARLPQATDPYQTVEALWAYAALRAGIPASQIVAYLGHAPLGLPVLKLVGTHGSCVRVPSDNREAGLSQGEKPLNTEPSAPILRSQNCAADTPQDTEPSAPILRSQYRAADTPQDTEPSAPILRSQNCEAYTPKFNSYEKYFPQLGKIFLDNPPCWYAMSLRPGVRFTQLSRRIALLSKPQTEHRVHFDKDILRSRYCAADTARSADTTLSDIQLFYPCEEITRAIGKKIVVRQRPFIHSVVFFKAKLTDIGRLFARIGDLAWCYRQNSRPGAPYADISQRQFERFQQTISNFTPDYEVAPSGELELKKNDRVQIVGGLFTGHEATFDSVEKAEEGVVYRLNIIGENGFEWRIAVDKRLTEQKN